jgi:hypothetical protein
MWKFLSLNLSTYWLRASISTALNVRSAPAPAVRLWIIIMSFTAEEEKAQLLKANGKFA